MYKGRQSKCIFMKNCHIKIWVKKIQSPVKEELDIQEQPKLLKTYDPFTWTCIPNLRIIHQVRTEKFMTQTMLL